MSLKNQKLIRQLREDEVSELVFPSSLSNVERKFLHHHAEELGLKSQSKGKGTDRYITISKRETAAVAEEKQHRFQLKAEVEEILVSYFQKFPLVKQHENTQISDSILRRHVSSKQNKNLSSNTSSTQVALESSFQVMQSRMLSNPSYKSNLLKRNHLPASAHRDLLCETILNHQIVLVSGETGCGKSTQVPQFLLEHPSIGPTCRIVVTQPRRLSAISLAERIAWERCEKVGQSIGYQIRLESEKSSNTQILFVTPGVLLRKLYQDPMLSEFTHIIIDEAHERDYQTEFLLIILRDLYQQRKSMKLVLMSATLNTDRLANYFSSIYGNQIPHISMGGSVFPVQEFFLEHVLMYTNHLDRHTNANSKTSHSQASPLLTLLQAQNYMCAFCGAGPFLSPIELGNHAAFCEAITGTTPVQSLPPHAHKNQGRAKAVPPPTPSLRDIVKAVTTHTAHEIRQKALRDFVPKANRPFERGSQDDGDDTDRHTGTRNAQTKTSLKQSMAETVHDDAVQVNDEEREGGGEGGWVREDEDMDFNDDNDDEGVVVPVVSSAAETMTPVDENVAIEEELVTQYQLSWDDNQVDLDLIMSLLKYICHSEFGNNSGSILIFLPGWDDISTLYRLMSSLPDYQLDTRNKFKILQLHSGVSKQSQFEIFQPAPKGFRKIILSTNIAETSVTIDDVVVVIDSGRLKERTYDPHVKLVYLKPNWISQASARQRKGRAGRTAAGVCFHLFSKKRYASLLPSQESELLRMPLDELVIQTKLLGLAPGQGDEADSVKSFLSKALDPPHHLSIRNAIRTLQAIGCLDANEQLTAIGYSVAQLPLPPTTARLLLLGAMFGCVDQIVRAGAVIGFRDPFLLATNDSQRESCRRIKWKLSEGFFSDQYLIAKALENYHNIITKSGKGQADRYCDDNYLSTSTMIYLNDLCTQLLRNLEEIQIDKWKNPSFNRNNRDSSLIASLISVSLYPNFAIKHPGNQLFVTQKGRKAKMHPSSVNKVLSREGLEACGYQDMSTITSSSGPPIVGGASLQMLNCSRISVFALLLICGELTYGGMDETVAAEDEEEEEERLDDDDDDNDENQTALDEKRDCINLNAVDDVVESQGTGEEFILVVIDYWLQIKIQRKILSLIIKSRSLLRNVFEQFINSPNSKLPESHKEAVEVLARCLSLEHSVDPKFSESSGQGGNYRSNYNNRSDGRSSEGFVRGNRGGRTAGGGRRASNIGRGR